MTDKQSGLARSAAAYRQRLRRQRRRAGVVVVPVEVSFDLLAALADAGKCSWNEGDRAVIGNAATDALCEWAGVTRDGDDCDDEVLFGADLEDANDEA
ncbi:MAG: hypothetical protein ACOC9Q_00820 [bacterium]